MPGVSVNIDFAELQELAADFKKRGGNLEGVTEVIAADLAAAVEENFERERGHEQGKWPALAKSTLKKMSPRRRASSFKILRDTGALAGSITPYSDGLVAEAYTNVPYAKYHTSKLPRTKIRLRDFLDVDIDKVMKDTAELLLAEVIPP